MLLYVKKLCIFLNKCFCTFQTSVNRTKVDTLISFPLSDLDMSHHVAKKPSAVQTVNKGVTGWSPWRPNRKSPSTPEDYIYDLYGVCNHYGNMQGGHYTGKFGEDSSTLFLDLYLQKEGDILTSTLSGCSFEFWIQNPEVRKLVIVCWCLLAFNRAS